MRAGVWLLAALTLVACEEGGDEPSGRDIREDAIRHEYEGEELYAQYCSLCHGTDGEGYAADNAPSLRSPEWLRTASNEYIEQAIRLGRPGTPMSAWSRMQGGPLNDQSIDAIITYLRSRQDHPPASVDHIEINGDASNGRTIYAMQCARCHGAQGEGVDAVSLANPMLLATASDGFLQYAVAHGRTGTPMPSFLEELSPTEIDDVITFVRSFGPQLVRPPPELPQTPREAVQLPSLEDMELVINPDGATPRFTLRDERFVSSAQVQRALGRGQRMVILDARATSDWLRGRIPGSLPVPFYELSEIIENLPRDGTWMIAYCACPHAASGRVVDALRAQGFTNTAVLDEGIEHWTEEGYPTSSGEAQP